MVLSISLSESEYYTQVGVSIADNVDNTNNNNNIIIIIIILYFLSVGT